MQNDSRIPNPKRRRFRPLSGILLLDKPLGLSSNQALQKARHLFEAEKAGHTGSLDPLATGLLPLCFGEATKIAGHLLGARKAYAATVQLGATTSTDDAEGEILERRPVADYSADAIEAALASLRGRIEQIPPAYSAIKQGGVALYKRARRGEDVAVPVRTVEVHRLELRAQRADQLELEVECGSGTYVRSLARDLGARLGCGAHLSALRRLWVEPFCVPQMHTLAQLAQVRETSGLAGLDALLLPLTAGLAGLPRVTLSDVDAARLRRGQPLQLAAQPALPLGAALDAQGAPVALIEIAGDGAVRVLRGFNG